MSRSPPSKEPARKEAFRARLVLPISTPLIEDGAVCLAGNRIVAAGSWKRMKKDFIGPVIDLGEVILLPGLINAHCHLDYTDMAGQLGRPRHFTDWLKSIVSLKAGWSYSEFAASWLRGAKMLLANGVTTVMDIEAVPELLMEVRQSMPLRLISLLEIIALRNKISPQQLIQQTLRGLSELADERCTVGLSPHAAYTTTPELLQACAERARQDRLLVSSHVAESSEEFEMFMYGRSPLFDWLKNQRSMDDCGHGSPVQHFQKQQLLGNNFLAVHVNYLWERDAAILSEHQVSVVHCPRSHKFFGHGRFPLEQLSNVGVNICLGTDSLASVSKTSLEPLDLNMFSEMRVLSSTASALSAEDIVKMATVNAGKALRKEGELGVLAPGALADMVTLPYDGSPTEVYEAVVQHRGSVTASMIGGEWVYSSGEN